ncbi:MBL fold metallo-hydrolase [Nocardioides bigeumensis]|uniref:MBL fold metallo-hydrolase n=1 Tax=Nocardioides bigeumensis TaxID=433657 RepID=A0ABN2Y483_9ACTN
MSDRGPERPVLSFLGAVATVTGSHFLVEHRDTRILVEAGLYQGLAELRRRNWEPFPLSPASIDAVVLTHAHLDHCGYLPRLVKEGFAGTVTCTDHTAALAGIVLRDSAHLQEEDAQDANRLGWSKHRPALPLYDRDDVERTMPHFRPVAFGQVVDLGPETAVRLQPAGHILGSSVVVLETAGRRVVFSGDLGRASHPLLGPPAPPPACDALVVESTYGDRHHPIPDPDLLATTVTRTIRRGGSVLIPAFAVDRTELVLLELSRLMVSGAIPRVPLYVDSPMALAALEVYRQALREGSAELRADAAESLDALGGLAVTTVTSAAESIALNRPSHPCIIVSASGMATGGRVVHHLEHQLPDPRNCVVLTGYQAEGTRGRQLAEGARQVKMHGRYVPVRAEIVQDVEFSAHADADEIVGWISSAESLPRTVYVVHGEEHAAQALATRLSRELDLCAVVPRLGERVRLG